LWAYFKIYLDDSFSTDNSTKGPGVGGEEQNNNSQKDEPPLNEQDNTQEEETHQRFRQRERRAPLIEYDLIWKERKYDWNYLYTNPARFEGRVVGAFLLACLCLFLYELEGYIHSVIKAYSQPMWLAQTMIQVVLTDIWPVLTNDKILLKKYGLVCVNDKSIAFQEFDSGKKVCITFFVYKPTNAARAASIYIDLEKEGDEYVVTSAYACCTDGTIHYLDVKETRYNIHDDRFSEEGMINMMIESREIEVQQQKEEREREQRRHLG